jgi:hypothetical protein
MKTALLSVLLLSAAAGADPNRTDAPGPATSSPSSGDCGFPGAMGINDLHGQIQALYDDVFILSGISGRKPTLVFQDDPSPKPSPARCRRAGGRRDSTEFEIVVSQRLCELSHSLDQTAFIFGHELGHYAKGHVPELEKANDAAMAECSQDADCAAQKIKSLRMAREEEADSFAVETLSKPGSRYQASAGADSMARYQDLRWVLDQDQAPDGLHDPLSQRADAIRAQAAAAAAR